MAKKFGGAKQKCMQRIRSPRTVYKPQIFLIFFRSNLQMGKSKEGLGVGEERDLREREEEKPDVAVDEQQRMNR